MVRIIGNVVYWAHCLQRTYVLQLRTILCENFLRTTLIVGAGNRESLFIAESCPATSLDRILVRTYISYFSLVLWTT
jgi:hypothetical protein